MQRARCLCTNTHKTRSKGILHSAHAIPHFSFSFFSFFFPHAGWRLILPPTCVTGVRPKGDHFWALNPWPLNPSTPVLQADAPAVDTELLRGEVGPVHLRRHAQWGKWWASMKHTCYASDSEQGSRVNNVPLLYLLFISNVRKYLKKMLR